MARVLALAGEAAERAGMAADAADLYFRAGRSAEVEGGPADARRWLGAAARLAETTGQTEILAQANERLESLAEAIAERRDFVGFGRAAAASPGKSPRRVRRGAGLAGALLLG